MRIAIIDSPVGHLRLVEDRGAIIAVSRTEAALCPEDTPLLRECSRQLTAYFAGTLTVFDLPIRLEGTAFRLKVWEALRTIPYGETRSYGELARMIGQPSASRAVGGANHHNPISIIVPCHRIIGADGSLTGYGGGLDMKSWLLEHERKHDHA